MAKDEESPSAEEEIEVDLRDPWLAAFLAWLWPGAGHMYQRRYAKGTVFMICILGTFFFGLTLGGGRVVYASWVEYDRRWQYGCQVLVGAPALPAIVQNMLVRAGNEPMFGGYMSPPGEIVPDGNDELAQWHAQLDFSFEMGTLYTVIAGLLNVLAIFDAYAGPVAAAPDSQSDKPPPNDKDEKKKQPAEE